MKQRMQPFNVESPTRSPQPYSKLKILTSITVVFALIVAGAVLSQPKVIEASQVHVELESPKAVHPLSFHTKLPITVFDVRKEMGPVAVGDIVGGLRVVSPYDYPYVVSVESHHHGGHICGGVIFNARTIISAAHCTQLGATNYAIHAGGLTRGRHQQVRQVIQVYNHPRYLQGRGYHPNDISVLILRRPLKMNWKVTKGIFPYQGEDLPEFMPARLLGYGKTCGTCPTTAELMEGDVDVLPSSDCSLWFSYHFQSKIMLCLGGTSSGACRGDSGGPMEAGGKIYGVTSWGSAGCHTRYPSVYTKLSVYMNWIHAMKASP